MNQNLHELAVKLGLPADEAIDFRGLVYSFWENKWLIFISTFTVMMLAIILLLLKTPQYEANVLVQVKNKNHNSLTSLSQQLNLTPTESDPIAAQIALVRSRYILSPVVKQLGLATSIQAKPSLFTSHSALLAQSLSVNDFIVPPTLYGQKLILKIIDETHYQLFDANKKLLIAGELGKLAVSPSGILLQVNSMKGKHGAEFILIKNSEENIVAKLMHKLQIEQLGDSGGMSSSQTGILQISLIDTDAKRVANILNAIATVMQEKDMELKSLESQKTLDFLNQQLPIAKESLVAAEAIYNRYREKTGKLDIKFESQQLMQRLITLDRQLTEVTLNKDDLLQRFTDKHPIIIGINEKIKELRKQKTDLINEVKALPAEDQVAVDYIRDIRVKTDLYLILLHKMEELRIVKAGTVSDIRILCDASTPYMPLSKQGGVTVAASLVLGLIVGIILVFARKAFLRRVNDPRWVEQNLNLTNLAIVPFSKQQVKNEKMFKLRETTSLAILADKFSRDLSVEALRSLRTSLQLIINSASNNIISLTGISQGIGKSFVSVNLSYLLADTGKNVLLIDGDMRKGHLNDYFSLQRASGLSECLAGSISLEIAIKKTAYKNLHFMPCGNYPPNPAELLMRPSFKTMLEDLSQQYDIVIIDTAPVLAVTDSTIVGTSAGMNLLVIGSDTHQPEEISMSAKRLTHAGIKIFGTIFNVLKQEATVSGNFRYSYYSHYDTDEKIPSRAAS